MKTLKTSSINCKKKLVKYIILKDLWFICKFKMLNKIEKALKKEGVDTAQSSWVFISAFDKNKNLLISKGVLESSFPLNEAIERLWEGFFISQEKKIKYLVIDVVKLVEKVGLMRDVLSTNVADYGVGIVFNSSPQEIEALLPNTTGVANIKQALAFIKQKAWGRPLEDVDFYRFKTQRVVI